MNDKDKKLMKWTQKSLKTQYICEQLDNDCYESVYQYEMLIQKLGYSTRPPE